MKPLNLQIFEEILEPMFPNEFQVENRGADCLVIYENIEKGTQDYKNFEHGLYCAFWLAEKVKLFDRHQLSRPYNNDDWCISDSFYEADADVVIRAETIPEVICKAVLEIYRKEVGGLV